MNYTLKRLVLGCVLVALGLPAQGEVYRWVDENGKLHFSDRAPQGRDSERIEMPEQAPEPVGREISDAERMQRQQKLVKMLEEERLQKESEKRAAKEKAEEHALKCTRMKNRLTYMERYSRFFNEKEDGTREYLSDEQADAYRKKMHDQYNKHCQR